MKKDYTLKNTDKFHSAFIANLKKGKAEKFSVQVQTDLKKYNVSGYFVKEMFGGTRMFENTDMIACITGDPSVYVKWLKDYKEPSRIVQHNDGRFLMNLLDDFMFGKRVKFKDHESVEITSVKYGKITLFDAEYSQ